MTLLAVSEAAEQLGVTTRQVQHLARSGDVHMLARGVVDAASVDRLLAVRAGGRHRAWSEETAWGSVALLSGVSPTWMGASQRSRLKHQLLTSSVAGLVARSRGRCVTRSYSGHSSAVALLRRDLVDLTGSATTLGLVDGGTVDAYVAREEVDGVVARYGLVRDDSGRFVLRDTDMDMKQVAELAETSNVLVSLDLAESLDARERQVGRSGLRQALERFGG